MDLKKPIVMDFAGTHSTGKTTVIKQTCKIWRSLNVDVNIVSSISRTMKDDLNLFLYDKTDGFTQSFISLGNFGNILDSTLKHHVTLCTDFGLRTLAYTLASAKMDDYTMALHWKWMDILNSGIFGVDVYRFYLPIEFGMESDGIRKEDEDYRKDVDERIIWIIKTCKLMVRTLTGSSNDRALQVKSLIKDIIKFQT